MLFNFKHKIGIFLTCLTAGVALNMPVALANPLDVIIHNHTGSNIQHIYLSDSRHDKWEEDVLGTNILKPGGDFDIHFSSPADWCLFDLRAVFSNGNYAEKYNINLCEIKNFYINP